MTISLSEKQPIEHPEDSDVILSIEGVSKKFCRSLKHSLFYGVRDIATDMVGLRKENSTLRNKEFWALDNVSFKLKKGEALGLVGKNGSGKSTLLRIIAGLIKPDRGRVRVRGRVAPLIALGAGFNPILTGRENIYANMSVLGLSTEEIRERFDDVVEFAEIGDAIDAPVQTYSSGMAARLGFASAIHTEPDILLIDEVLAVGDIRFRQKCFRRLGKLRQKGTSFILVSHNSQAFFTVCKSAIHISKGIMLGQGSVEKIIQQYEDEIFLGDISKQKTIGHFKKKKLSSNNRNDLEILEIYFRNSKHKIINTPITGENIYLKIKCKCARKIEKTTIYLLINQISGEKETILSLDSIAQNKTMSLLVGNNEISVFFLHLGLRPGNYTAKVIIKEDSISVLDFVERFQFIVESKKPMSSSLYYQPIELSID